jgi:hypothetical protein
MDGRGLGIGGHTLTPKQNRQIPQLRHIERLKNLSLIARPITIQRNRRILIPIILMRKRQPGTNRDLRTHNPIPTIEALSKHMHGASLSVGNALTTAKQLADDGFHRGAAHEREAVAAVGGDDVVFLGERVLDADGDGFLAGGEMAEAADLLLFV